MKTSPKRTERSRTRLFRHLKLHRLTTVPAAARAAFHGDEPRAQQALNRMERARHVRKRGDIYRTLRNPAAPRDIPACYAVLWYCWLAPDPRPPIHQEVLERTLMPLAQNLGRSVPRAVCYRSSTGRLALLRASRSAPRSLEASNDGSLDLQRELATLQDYVNSTGFTFWAHLAQTGGFELTHLLPLQAAADELTRWLARRPLVTRIPPSPTVIPTAAQYAPFAP